MWVSILGSWFIMVPLAYLFGLVLEMGAVGAWMGLTAQIIVAAGINVWRLRTEPWR